MKKKKETRRMAFEIKECVRMASLLFHAKSLSYPIGDGDSDGPLAYTQTHLRGERKQKKGLLKLSSPNK